MTPTFHYVSTRMDFIRALPKNSEGVEIGVWSGGFSAEILTATIGRLHLVDQWAHLPHMEDTPVNYSQKIHDINERAVRDNLKVYIQSGVVSVHKGSSTGVAKDFRDECFDWIYLDADHCYDAVLADLFTWSPKIKPGGVILGHDYLDNEHARDLQFGVIPAVHDFCNSTEWRLTGLTRHDYWPSYQLKRL